ncbi:MAG: hypothetical protein HYY06_05525 [Deltaproteobacteria bacterium]|nr:hypothetical protein [Deltaproteobacteria bacterium]
MRLLRKIWVLVLGVCASVWLGCGEPDTEIEESYLHVWAGPRRPHDGLETPPGNDVLITVDLRTRRAVHVLDVGSANNEPHHMMRCGERLFAGGLFSGRVFVFDLATPERPALEATLEGAEVGLGVADDFMCMQDGSVVATMMGDAAGGSPGGMLRIDPDLTFHGILPQGAPEGCNPHGLDVDMERGLLVTTDLMELASVASEPPAPAVRDTIRIWDADSLEVTDTVQVCCGPMEARFVPGDPDGRILVACMADGAFGLVEPGADGKWGWRPLLDVDGADELVAFPGITRLSPDGRTVWMALSGYGEVRRYDIADPSGPVLEATATVGKGAHFMTFSDDGERGYVSDYVVQRLEAVTGMAPADDKVWRFDTATMKAEVILDVRDEGDDPLLAGRLPLQPHGLALHN